MPASFSDQLRQPARLPKPMGNLQRERCIFRILLLILLASCSFNIDETESIWRPSSDSSRGSGSQRRGRISRAASVQPHFFRPSSAPDPGSGPSPADLAPFESLVTAPRECGRIAVALAVQPALAYRRSVIARGPPPEQAL